MKHSSARSEHSPVVISTAAASAVWPSSGPDGKNTVSVIRDTILDRDHGRRSLTLWDCPSVGGASRRTGSVICVYRGCGCASVCAGRPDRSRRIASGCAGTGAPWTSFDRALRNTRGHSSRSSKHTLSSQIEQTEPKLTLPISLSELDLDLPSAHPLPVQVVQGVLRVTDIFKRAALLRALTAQYTLQDST